MQRISQSKFLLAAAVAIGTLGAASAAQARPDVHLSIGIPLGGYVQHAPVYHQPRPVYVQPAPIYYQQPPLYVQHAPVYVHPSAYHGQHRFDGRRGWRDSDRDGVPNRFDHAPRNPYRR